MLLGAHRRVSRLPAAAAAGSRDTSSKPPRFFRRGRRFGAFLVGEGFLTAHTLATCANGAPNVVPVAFKDVTAEGKLAVGDVFLDTTPEKVIVTAPGADNKKEL